LEELPRDLQWREHTAELDDVSIAAAGDLEADQKGQEAADRQRELHAREGDCWRKHGDIRANYLSAPSGTLLHVPILAVGPHLLYLLDERAQLLYRLARIHWGRWRHRRFRLGGLYLRLGEG